MAAPIPDELDDTGRDIYSRLGTIYENQSAGTRFPAFTASFIRALDAFRAQLKSQGA